MWKAVAALARCGTTVATLLAAIGGAATATAAEFPLTLYMPSFVNDGVTDFKTDYTVWSQCTLEIDDAAIAPGVFVDINSSAFKRLECSIRGNDRTYQFSYGTDVAEKDYWYGNSLTSPVQLGVLFGSNAKPLRFDVPQIASQSSSYGFYDSPAQGFGGFSTHTFWGPTDDNNFNTPAAVLLEPTVMFGVTRAKGSIVSSAQVPAGAKIGLLNGHFVFNEQWLRDGDNSPIPNPLSTNGGYYSFDEKLTVPSVRVTQATFEPAGSEIFLVDERTTAILVHKAPLTDDIRLRIRERNRPDLPPVMDVGTNAFSPYGQSEYQLAMYCSAATSPRYCGMQNNKRYEISVEADGVAIGAVHDVDIEATLSVELMYIPVNYPACGANGCIAVNDQISFAESSNRFVQSTYPLADRGLDLVADLHTNALGSSLQPPVRGANPTGWFCPVADYWLCPKLEDLYQNMAAVFRHAALHRKGTTPYWGAIGIVPDSYFAASGYAGAAGVRNVNWGRVALVALEGHGNTTAHELAHVFGHVTDPEEYQVAWPGKRAEGFDIYGFYSSRLRERKINFMGNNAAVVEAAYWVNSETWNILFDRLSIGFTDPPLLTLSLIIDRDGSVQSLDWLETDGFPTGHETGSYRIELRNKAGTVLETSRFAPDFSLLVEPVGVVATRDLLINTEISFPKEVMSLHVIDSSGLTLLAIDPVRKLLTDYVNAVKGSCSLDATTAATVDRHTTQISSDLASGAVSTATRDAVTTLGQTVLRILPQACDFAAHGQPFDSPAVIHELLNKLAPRVADRITVLPPVPGDLNADRRLDALDYQLIRAALNKCQGQVGFLAAADFNSNNCIGYDDYQAWYAIYRQQ